MNTLMRRTNGNGGTMPVTSFSGLVDKIFQDNVNRIFDDGFWGNKGLEHATSVPVNVQETDKSYELDLVAPGLKKEDFKINVSGEMLTVSFEHKEDASQQSKEEGWLRKEYKLRSFSRMFTIDNTIDVAKIEARYNDGMLHLSIPKKEDAQAVSRVIEIK